jgi:hypothetical protein
MTTVLSLADLRNKLQFKVDYPYYGLFGSAQVTTVGSNSENVFKCTLLNGNIIFLKKSMPARKWIDVHQNLETPLSAIIGTSIDDFLKQGA